MAAELLQEKVLLAAEQEEDRGAELPASEEEEGLSAAEKEQEGAQRENRL